MTLTPSQLTDAERERRDAQRHDLEIALASCASPLNPDWFGAPDCDRIYIDRMFCIGNDGGCSAGLRPS